MKDLYAALDIGSSKVVMTAGSVVDGRLYVQAFAQVPSQGVKKGAIRDIDAVIRCITDVLKQCAAQGFNLVRVAVNYSGMDIKSVPRSGLKTLPVNHSVTDDDIAVAEENARASSPTPEAQVLHFIRQNYLVDKHPYSNPLDLQGSSLEAFILEISADKTPLEALKTVVHKSGLCMDGTVYSILADSEAVLTTENRANGALLINFGAGKLDYAAFCNSTLATAGTIGVGGNHLTNDLAIAFNLPQNSAEKLKLTKGTAVLQTESVHERYDAPNLFATGAARSLSVQAIQTVTTERVDELFRLLQQELISKDLLHLLHDGIFLTGGSAELPLLCEKVKDIFGMTCRLGTLQEVTDLPEAVCKHPLAYSTAIGLLKYTIRANSDSERTESWFEKIKAYFKG